MNEQIRELAKQAGGHKCLCIDSISLSLLGENSIEKFAELIVRECMKLNKVETTARDLPEYNLGMLEGYRRARENISIHFGVKNEPNGN